MSTQTNSDPVYALGQSEEEERRLQRQSVLMDPATRRLFDAAGIGPGLKVLDIGSGAGDVAMLAARVVGPTGSVVGVEMNPAIVETARRRARAAGHTNVTFVAGDIRDVPFDDDFDAVVGRLILCHVPDPAAMLRRLVPHLRSGGVAAFYELDLTVPGAAYPTTPLSEKVFRWVVQGLTYAGVDATTGTGLHRTFLDAGLEAPELLVDALAGGSPAALEELTIYAAETVRTILPALIKGGFATEAEVGIDTLAGRWRDELLAHRSIVRANLFIGAWAHTV